MRLEYVVIGFVLVLVVLIVSISMLSGAVPTMDSVFRTLTGR